MSDTKKSFAFYGRVSTEDQQDPSSSRAWQLRRSQELIEPHGGEIVAEFFDVAQSRMAPWKRLWGTRTQFRLLTRIVEARSPLGATRRRVGKRRGEEPVRPLLREPPRVGEYDLDLRVSHLKAREGVCDPGTRDVLELEDSRVAALDDDGGKRQLRETLDLEGECAVGKARAEVFEGLALYRREQGATRSHRVVTGSNATPGRGPPGSTATPSRKASLMVPRSSRRRRSPPARGGEP